MVNRDDVDELVIAITRRGLAGASETDLLLEACGRAVAIGVPICRASFIVDTLHPVHEGRVFRWRVDVPDAIEMLEYGRTNRPGQLGTENWLRSPFHHMFHNGIERMRRRLAPEVLDEFPIFREIHEDGQTDWIALVDRFTPGTEIGAMECLFSSWSTDRPAGFADDEILALKRLVSPLSLAIKSTSLARIAETLVETYLGRDAGRRVLAGRIERGVTDRIEAVLWFSDLRDYTRITDTADPEHIIPLLNDYAEIVISAVHEAGGDILKLIGDGTLAIFAKDHLADACRSALSAERLVRERLASVNGKRSAEGLPVTQVYLGLHVGEVFYGNIGSHERLDFTVVGPAVNEASRIAAMCRSVDREVLVSGAFRAAMADRERERLISVGRYALRGVERPAELFTLDRGVAPDGARLADPMPAEAR